MEHLAETMTDFLLRRKYITEEQTEWCHYMLIKNIMSITVPQSKSDCLPKKRHTPLKLPRMESAA